MANPLASRRWRFAALLLVVGAVFGWLVYSRSSSPRPARTIHDAAFAASANRLCAATLPRLRASAEPVRSEDDREAETAAAIDKASAGIDALVVQLRGLDVRPADAAKVDAWLADWNAYTAAGRRYAAAIRRGDPLKYGLVDDESVAPLRAVSSFARANFIDACIP